MDAVGRREHPAGPPADTHRSNEVGIVPHQRLLPAVKDLGILRVKTFRTVGRSRQQKRGFTHPNAAAILLVSTGNTLVLEPDFIVV